MQETETPNNFTNDPNGNNKNLQSPKKCKFEAPKIIKLCDGVAATKGFGFDGPGGWEPEDS